MVSGFANMLISTGLDIFLAVPNLILCCLDVYRYLLVKMTLLGLIVF